MSESTAIAPVEAQSSALVTRAYLAEKSALVRELYAQGTSDLEFEHFLETCATRGLNPLAKQIYCVMRWDKEQRRKVPTIQTSIDGYRLIAQRTGEYRGQVGPHWCGPDGVWREVWLDDSPPAAARVGVLRAGFSEPLYGVARWSSYVQTTKEGEPSKFWAQMPDVMLAKVAESLALRKAFPEELSGLYTADEMGQAGSSGQPVGTPTVPELAGVEGYESRYAALKAHIQAKGLDPTSIWTGAGVATQKDLDDDDVYAQARRAVGDDPDDEPIEGEVVEPPRPTGDGPATDEQAADAAWEESGQTSLSPPEAGHRDPQAVDAETQRIADAAIAEFGDRR